MSPRHPDAPSAQPRISARAFAALGDETRLLLLSRLSDGRRHSISELTVGTQLTRQAVTKHLRVLERVRLVHSTRMGRESLFALNPEPLDELQQFLQRLSAGWDHALSRLKLFLENT